MAKRRDRDEWTAYGQHGPGRPKIGGEEMHATIPAAHVAALDAIAAARGLKRPDILREAVAYYLRHHQAAAQDTEDNHGRSP